MGKSGKKIYCVRCGQDVLAELVTGADVYPHREDLKTLYFWRCHQCNNFVGTHRNSPRHAPLGVIPTPELKRARQKIHELIDWPWKEGKISRTKLYSIMSYKLGYKYHTAKIKSMEEASRVYREALAIVSEFR